MVLGADELAYDSPPRLFAPRVSRLKYNILFRVGLPTRPVRVANLIRLADDRESGDVVA